VLTDEGVRERWVAGSDERYQMVRDAVEDLADAAAEAAARRAEPTHTEL
jgi:hypothetical protein